VDLAPSRAVAYLTWPGSSSAQTEVFRVTAEEPAPH